jgi:hypothetical protein
MELIILSLLLIKHFYVDFVHQTIEHVQNKGTYGHLKGLEHSAWHGSLTALIFWIWLEPNQALFLGLVDFFLHYHIDYVKMRYGEKDSTDKKYWKHFGLDQLAHNLTYILLILIMIGL